MASFIRSIRILPLNVPLQEPFAISGGQLNAAENVIVRVELESGARGYGEAAPFEAYNGQTQKSTLAALTSAAPKIIGAEASSWKRVLEKIEGEIGPDGGAASAALQMAVLDAWCRFRGLALHALFGSAQSRLDSDVTVTLAGSALLTAERLAKAGVRCAKIKVGRGVEEDEKRILEVSSVRPKFQLILDANQGYSASQAVRLIQRLRRRKVEPLLFEQPVAKEDLEGLREVERSGKIIVCADESARTAADVLGIVRKRLVSAVNIKLMKSGFLEAWRIASIARASGLKLMIGGNVESSLAMGAAAHFAAGLGGFSFVDLDTPLWFAGEPMRGLKVSKAGVYELAGAGPGIGVFPRPGLFSKTYC